VTTASARRDELAANLDAVRTRIAAAEVAAGRESGSVTLIGITKTFPASDVGILAELGLADVGENRDHEARMKAAELRPAWGSLLRWHFVGQVQRNKVVSIVRYADVVHTVDRLALATALSDAARGRAAPLEVLIQVSLDVADTGSPGSSGRGGAAPADVERLAAGVGDSPHLRLRGVMGVAPLGGDADLAFARLAEIAASVRSTYPEAALVSAGMTGDLESAIRHGATHVRVGSALMGSRSAPGR
jgi:pyridoxal phosphate enzyme (YggS family)